METKKTLEKSLGHGKKKEFDTQNVLKARETVCNPYLRSLWKWIEKLALREKVWGDT